MDKTRFVKARQNKVTGVKEERIGVLTGIFSSDGTELKSGDLIRYYDTLCVVLYNRYTRKYEAMILDSCWYYDRDLYNPGCYGKSYRLPRDNGAKMEIEYISSDRNIIQIEHQHAC